MCRVGRHRAPQRRKGRPAGSRYRPMTGRSDRCSLGDRALLGTLNTALWVKCFKGNDAALRELPAARPERRQRRPHRRLPRRQYATIFHQPAGCASTSVARPSGGSRRCSLPSTTSSRSTSGGSGSRGSRSVALPGVVRGLRFPGSRSWVRFDPRGARYRKPGALARSALSRGSTSRSYRRSEPRSRLACCFRISSA